jgi:uncharacterized membrane protein
VIAGLTPVGAIHAVLAISGIAVGLCQFLRPRGGAIHRARGYAFVYAMLIADGTAMLIFQFTGRFNILHIGAMTNLACIVAAMVPMLRSPKPSNWRNQHYYWMSWSYVGLLAATATEFVAHRSSRDKAAGLDGDCCDLGHCDPDRLCPHQSLSARSGTASNSERCIDPA